MSSLPPMVSNKTAHFPRSLEFFVEDRKRLLRDGANVGHIQELFSVICSIHAAGDHVRGDWATVTVGCNSQELLEKAKVIMPSSGLDSLPCSCGVQCTLNWGCIAKARLAWSKASRPLLGVWPKVLPVAQLALQKRLI